MKYIDGINEVINKYDVFILDQWGVIHNGDQAYKDAVKTVDYLKRNNKKIIIISNSSKRNQSSLQKLPILGFNLSSIDVLITSGEMIWKTLSFSRDKYAKNLNKCFHIFDNSREDGFSYREGLKDVEFVDNLKESDFILACTPFNNSKPLDYIPILKEAYEKNLLMFCANPDFETVQKDNNKNIFCMGTIAELYQDMGGKVIIQGKPSIDIYLEATKSLDITKKSKIVAIGDSLFHDIRGANNFNIDSILITSGIHSESFSKYKPLWNSNINNLLKFNITPTYISYKFSI